MGTKYQPFVFYLFIFFKLLLLIWKLFSLSYTLSPGFNVLKLGFYIFIKNLMVFFLLQGIASLLRQLTLSHSRITKWFSKAFFIHHLPGASMDKIFSIVAKFCFCSKGTLPYQYQIAPACAPEWVFSLSLYAAAISFC